LAVTTNTDLTKGIARTAVVAASRASRAIRTSHMHRICAGAHDTVERHTAFGADTSKAHLVCARARPLPCQIIDRRRATCACWAEVELDICTRAGWHLHVGW
jgi:hypothetical protein